MRTKLLWAMALVILGVVNFAAWDKEQVLDKGQTILLELAPRDPRSLMQGDFMVLNYHLAGALRSQIKDRSLDGLAVITLDEQGVAKLDRVYQAGSALHANQALIRFRKRGEVVRIGAESFFFQEGHASIYSPAKYGEMKVATSGEVVLVGLRDAQRLPLRPAVSQNQ